MESEPPPPPPERPSRSPEHELRDRAKAAKLRHRAAKALLKAKRLEEHSRLLSERASSWETRADELDGVVRPPPQAPLDE
ncbi:MAG: hypothetical protein A3K59_07070 [Euryarchaeota archaeon RBG_19FT_COMBO_69_17]|nr:MAG: hypothetical protein A3K59_07070 [Euryarchaeota archaeon RBG_19FT_COMBO_69_17]